MLNNFTNSHFTNNENKKLTPKQLIMKHIFDPKHVVTDEELSQLDLGFKMILNDTSRDELKAQLRPA